MTRFTRATVLGVKTSQQVSPQTFLCLRAEPSAYEFDIRVPGADWKVLVLSDDNYVPNRAYAICVAWWGMDCTVHATEEALEIEYLQNLQ